VNLKNNNSNGNILKIKNYTLKIKNIEKSGGEIQNQKGKSEK